MNRLLVGSVSSLWFVGAMLASRPLSAEPAKTEADYVETRRLMAARLLPGDASSFAAFYEVCGLDCGAFLGYGGCAPDAHGLRCAAQIVDVRSKRPKVVAAPVVADAKQSTALARARLQLVAKLADVGDTPLWFEEHRFSATATEISRFALTLRWDAATRTLTVLEAGRPLRRVTTAPLPRGMHETSAAVWFHLLDAGGGAGWAILRLTGEDAKGTVAERVERFPIPWVGPSQ